jgi:hypothetical protein
MTMSHARILGWIACAGLALTAAPPVLAQAQAAKDAPTLRAVVVLDSSDLSSDFLTLAVANTGLGKLAGTRAVVLPQRDLTDAMRSTRTGENDIIIAPPHVTASALIHGYELVASTGLTSKYVLVGRSDFKGVADLKGRRAYFPQQDSLRSYVARGLLAQEGMTTRSLKDVTYGQTSGAGLLTLAGGGADATVALESEWLEWSKTQKSPGQVLAVSQAMPGGLGVVVKKTLPANVKAAVVQWVTSPDFVIPGVARMRPTSDAAPYEYVALADRGRLPHAAEQPRPRGGREPDELVVYGGIGKAARNWECFDAILATLRELETTRRCWCSRASRSACSAPTPTRRAC